MNQEIPKPCIPDANLLNVEEAAREAGEKGDVYIANETIEGMAREIREWRDWSMCSEERVIDLLRRAAEIDSRCQICGSPRTNGEHDDGCALAYAIQGLLAAKDGERVPSVVVGVCSCGNELSPGRCSACDNDE